MFCQIFFVLFIFLSSKSFRLFDLSIVLSFSSYNLKISYLEVKKTLCFFYLPFSPSPSSHTLQFPFSFFFKNVFLSFIPSFLNFSFFLSFLKETFYLGTNKISSFYILSPSPLTQCFSYPSPLCFFFFPFILSFFHSLFFLLNVSILFIILFFSSFSFFPFLFYPFLSFFLVILVTFSLRTNKNSPVCRSPPHYSSLFSCFPPPHILLPVLFTFINPFIFFFLQNFFPRCIL